MRLRVDRLTARLAIGITLLVILPLTVGLFVISQHHFDHTIAARRAAAEFENRILEVALRHQMLEKDSRLMTAVLQEIGQQPEVRNAMILDHEGVIRLSSNDDAVGVRISRDSPTCLVCHSKTPGARDRWVLLEDEGADVLRTVLPIENRRECQGCHGPEQKLNGILILDISLSPLQAQLRRDTYGMAAATAILTLLLLGGVGLLVRYLVLVRLGRLGRTARMIAAGDLGERATVEGDDVITSLAMDFNSMADATSSLIDEVKEREKQMVDVLNSLDDGLIVLDSDCRVVAANRSISRRMCTYPEAIRGKVCRDVTGHDLPCREHGGCPAARCLATGSSQQAVFHFPASDSEDGSVHEVYASPVFSDDGSVAQVVEVWRDITERVREEERLAEIEHLSSLGVLASGLSHEVNTPLASTLVCADAIIGRLEDRGADETGAETLDAIRESAETIREQVLRCRKITDQFLRFARRIPPSIEPIILQEVVQGVFSLVGPTAKEAGVTLELQGIDNLPLVAANTEVVQHVVLNVLINAIESFDDQGGKIRAHYLVGSDVRLQIRDTGCGISSDIRKHLFAPFRTQKPRGTGMGLFLSRTLMRRFGGDVRLVDSVVDQGSCLEIVFSHADQDPT